MMAKSYAWLVIPLGLCLVCTDGTPVADMLLIHLPFHSLSITIMKIPTWQQKTKRDSRLLFRSMTVSAVSAFGCLFRPAEAHHCYQQEISKVGIPDYSAFGGRYEYDFYTSRIISSTTSTSPCAIRLCLLSRLLTTTTGLVTLALSLTNLSTYFQPNVLLQWISSMPQLETLMIAFSSLFPTVI